MKLNPHKPDIAVQAQRQNLTGQSSLTPTHCSRLILGYNFELPSTFSFDEALLLCQISESEWVDFPIGETVLNTCQFCAR